MSTAIVLVLLLVFSFCMVVGLVTVLQSLINDDPMNEMNQPSVFQDQGADS
jgi:hypothetical protein